MAKETYNLLGFRPLTPCCASVRYFPIAASQTLAAGDPVILSSGQVAVAVAASSAELLGVVAEDCVSLAANTQVPVYCDPNTIFVARGSAAPSSCTIGTAYDLSGTTGAFEVNVAASSQALFTYLGVVPGDDNTVDGANMQVKIAKHALADLST